MQSKSFAAKVEIDKIKLVKGIAESINIKFLECGDMPDNIVDACYVATRLLRNVSECVKEMSEQKASIFELISALNLDENLKDEAEVAGKDILNKVKLDEDMPDSLKVFLENALERKLKEMKE